MKQRALAVAAHLHPGAGVHLEGEGQLSVAVVVGEELVLRFPRHAFGVARLTFEVRLLERIRPHLHIAVPEVVEVALNEPVGRAYVAHRYIRGRVVRSQDVASWTTARIQRVGADHPTVLCHTDLGGNIVFDDDTGAVGVIDFGSCMVTHPAFDLATLSVLGDDFVTACLTTNPDLGRAVDHAGAVRGTFALQDAIYGARQQDWGYVDDVLAGYAPG